MAAGAAHLPARQLLYHGSHRLFGRRHRLLTLLGPLLLVTVAAGWILLFSADQESVRSDKASSVAAAVLDEALTILAHAVEPAVQPSQAMLRLARSAIDTYLETLASGFVGPVEETPPVPDLAPLRAAGVPLADDQAFAVRVHSLSDRRRLLLGAVNSDAQTWPG